MRVFRGRKGSARNAAAPSPAAPSDPNLKLLPAGSSPSAPTTGSLPPAAPSSACPGAAAASSPASATAAWMADHGTGWFHGCCSCHDLAPPPLDGLDAGTMLAVASAPGKIPAEWREAWPLFMAWPHAAGAVYAVEMTAAQLRARLAAMDAG